MSGHGSRGTITSKVSRCFFKPLLQSVIGFLRLQMWRQNSLQGNQDSDETLSDEEELDRVTYDSDCTRKLQSLYSNEKKVQLTLPVLSRLESLIDKEKNPIFDDNEVNLRQINSSLPTRAWKLENFSSDYVSGKHGIQDENHKSLSSNQHHNESCNDSIFDEENIVISKLSATSGAATVRMSNSCNLESEDQYAAHTWSTIIEEAQELATVPKKTDNCPLISETSETRGIHIGGRGRAKVKFSFRPMPHRGNLSWATSLMDGNGKSCKDATDGPALHEKLEHKAGENSVAESFGHLQEESDELSVKVASHDERGGVPSMAELLENLQQKDAPSTGPTNVLLQNVKAKERKMQYGRKGIFPHLGSRVLDGEDPPEFSGGGFSSEDEDNDQSNFCGASQKFKGHTMTDLFQDAFNRSEAEGYSFPTNKPRIGYHGRLQQILQVEKYRHLDFLKHSQIVQSPSNDSDFMDVHILSRFLEAKLTVCRCLFGENTNSSQSVVGTNKCTTDVGTERTIIFNSKICDNVELEAGSFVRIHPPWKEVIVNEDEKIFLCMYFSSRMEGSLSYS